MERYLNCNLCARGCGINRANTRGACGVPSELYISRAALHMWEEPIISGTGGSGTIFFSGCSLGCVYCQNREISRGISGKPVSVARLAEIMLELEGQGAHNVNLVTPTHYAPSIIKAVSDARAAGLGVPIVYNTGSYDTPETVKSLEGTVDVYLPDLKYYLSKTAKSLSSASDYPTVARAAIHSMVKQVGDPQLSSDNIITRGVVVRILLLPGHLAEAKLNVKYLYSTYGDSVYLSLMNQYTPMPGMMPPLNRTVTRAEYRELCDYAADLGVTRAFIQEGGAATESYIPPFDNTGVILRQEYHAVKSVFDG